MHYMHTFLAPAWLACAFLARVLLIARASLDRVLSKTAAASVRSYIAFTLCEIALRTPVHAWGVAGHHFDAAMML